MPRSFFYSINLLIKSDSHLNKAISSVIADEDYFLEHVQLILIDSVCSEQSIAICTEFNKKYPKNIYFVDAAGRSEAAAYNDAKTLNFGHYIAYIDNYGEYSPKTLSTLQSRTLKSLKIPLLCIEPVVSLAGEKDKAYTKDIPKGIVELKETPDRFILMPGCWFFNKKIADMLVFDENVPFQADVKFIAEALLQTYSYIFTNDFRYTTTLPSDHDLFRYVPQYSRFFYTSCISSLVIPMLINYPASALVQSMMMYLICSRFALNADEKYKHVIIGSFVDEFLDKVSEALRYIDNSIILNRNICRMCGLDDEMPFRLLRLKYKQPELKPTVDLVLPKDQVEKSYYNSRMRLEKTVLSGELAAHYELALIGTSRDISANITAVNYDADGLYIDAVLCGCSFLDDSSYRIFVNINGDRYPVISSGVYTLKKCFDIPFLKRYSFRFFVPVSSGKKIDTVFLAMKYQNLSFRIGMTFDGVFSRLSTDIKNSYWSFLDRVMTYDRKSQSIVIRRATNNLLRMCESKFLAEAGAKVSFSEAMYYKQLRKSIRSTVEEKAGSKFLLFYDELGLNSNGNILFRYFSKHIKNDKAEIYYAARRDTEEFDYLLSEEYSGVLELDTKRAKIISASADFIFATDCDVYESLMFSSTDIMFLKDLINAKIISVKDFFITYATAQFDNRLRDNTQFFFCASEREREHITRSIYDYDESMTRITGDPIFDTLANEPEKLILIAPGDRRQFCIYDNSDFYRFSESRFFKLYNDILTDIRLHEAMKENGYRIAVLMPFSIEKYLRLFHSDDLVQLYECSDSNEAELVKKAAVLITDYCELQFRFAYLDKPVVYYYPQGLPVQQEYKNEGLARSSFGKLFFDHTSLTDHLITEMKNNFPQPESYSKQNNEFFRYHDKNNCLRILRTTKKLFLSDIFENSK